MTTAGRDDPGAGHRPDDLQREADEHEALRAHRQPSEIDILLDVPIVKVDEISLDVENLSAHVSLAARVGNLVQLNVGAEAHLGRLNLSIKGVEAQAHLEVYLERVYAILARTMATLDRNPELLAKLLEPVGQAVAAVGRTAEKTVPQLGQSLGNTVEKTVPEVGQSLGNTVEKTVPEVGKAAGRTIENTVPQLGQSLGNTVEKTVPEVGKAAGRTVENAAPEVGRIAIRRAAQRVATRAHHALGTARALAGIPHRGAAALRDAARGFRHGALRR